MKYILVTSFLAAIFWVSLHMTLEDVIYCGIAAVMLFFAVLAATSGPGS